MVEAIEENNQKEEDSNLTKQDQTEDDLKHSTSSQTPSNEQSNSAYDQEVARSEKSLSD